MKLLLIVAVSCLWVYAILLIVYTLLEIYWVNHPDKFKQAVIWKIEKEQKLSSDMPINTPENSFKPVKTSSLVTR